MRRGDIKRMVASTVVNLRAARHDATAVLVSGSEDNPVMPGDRPRTGGLVFFAVALVAMAVLWATPVTAQPVEYDMDSRFGLIGYRAEPSKLQQINNTADTLRRFNAARKSGECLRGHYYYERIVRYGDYRWFSTTPGGVYRGVLHPDPETRFWMKERLDELADSGSGVVVDWCDLFNK